jgi:Na+-translocating ferredoxin:NAD+ oxidoreductase RnfC subunit
MSQHIGAPAGTVVEVGGLVQKGDIIGTIPDGAAVSANVHASISGKIVSVGDGIVIRAM